jgi:hypothetical protein
MSEIAAFMAGVLVVILSLLIGWARELAELEQSQRAAEERLRREMP